MGRILIEGTPVALYSGSGSGGISLSGHLLLIYQDDAGNEFVVRGGPTRGGDPDYGPLIIEQNVPIANSIDERVDSDGNPVTAASRGSREIPLGERKAEDVWNLILQHAKNINDQSFLYNPTGSNSNGTVGNLLDLIGVNVNNVLPDPDGIMLIPFSGRNRRFEFDYTITGTDSNDIIVGRGGNQTFTGGKGNDGITGGKGNDTIDGGEGNDQSFYNGAFANYDIEFLSDESVRIIDKVTDRDGSDMLEGVDIAVFSDKLINLGPGQDIAFVIDTTGSMSDDIDAVKARASEIINVIFDADRGFLDSQIAVVGYNDPFTETFLSFTDQPKIDDRKTAALNAINSISVGGGGDFPEAVNAGLIRALSGGAGEWREEAVARRIILFGDAPPNDNELRAQVLELASDVGVSLERNATPMSIVGDIETSSVTPGLAVTRFAVTAADADGNQVTVPVEIFTVLIGDDPTTAADFASLATATGGEAFTAADASQVVDALIAVIEVPVNEAPNAQDDTVTTQQEMAVNVAVLINDSDSDGDTLAIDSFTQGSNGIVTLNDNGTSSDTTDDFLIYTPATQPDPTVGFTDSFEYTISDGNRAADTATVTVAVGKIENGGNGKDSLTGTSGDDLLTGFQGRDTISTGGGRDVIVYTSTVDGGDIINEFTIGSDKIDLVGVLKGISYQGSNPITDGVVSFGASASGSFVRIDPDGSSGQARATTFLDIRGPGVNPATLNNSDNFIFSIAA